MSKANHIPSTDYQERVVWLKPNRVRLIQMSSSNPLPHSIAGNRIATHTSAFSLQFVPLLQKRAHVLQSANDRLMQEQQPIQR